MYHLASDYTQASEPPTLPAMAAPSSPQALAPYPVWDRPVRASHWAIMLLFAWQFLTGQFGWLPNLHLWTGYLLLAVLLFRLLWGIVGSPSARFGPMLRSLGQLGSALGDLPRRRPGYRPGHNPVGALSVLLMLCLLLAQSMTGLFVETWGDLRGPLAERVSRNTALWLGDLHGLLRWPVLALILIHVGAAFWHLWWKHENRIGAMLAHGRLCLPADPQLEAATNARAALAFLASLLAVAAVVVFGPID